MSTRRSKVILVVCAVGALFIGALTYNWLTNRDAGRYLRHLHERIKTTDEGLSKLQKEQAALGQTVSSTAFRLLQRQKSYEARMADASDSKLRSAWGSYRLGFVMNRMEVLKIGTRLDTLRSVTEDLRGAVAELEAIQGMLSANGGGSLGASSTAHAVRTLEQRIAQIELVSQVAVQVVVEANSEIAAQRSLLKEQQRKIEALVPAGASEDNPVTKEIFGALESALAENRNTQDLLDQVEDSVAHLGKLVFAIRDIAKAESELHRAKRRS
jgi:uncharacterized coiled-coil protein SlyX